MQVNQLVYIGAINLKDTDDITAVPQEDLTLRRMCTYGHVADRCPIQQDNGVEIWWVKFLDGKVAPYKATELTPA